MPAVRPITLFAAFLLAAPSILAQKPAAKPKAAPDTTPDSVSKFLSSFSYRALGPAAYSGRVT